MKFVLTCTIPCAGVLNKNGCGSDSLGGHKLSTGVSRVKVRAHARLVGHVIHAFHLSKRGGSQVRRRLHCRSRLLCYLYPSRHGGLLFYSASGKSGKDIFITQVLAGPRRQNKQAYTEIDYRPSSLPRVSHAFIDQTSNVLPLNLCNKPWS